MKKIYYRPKNSPKGTPFRLGFAVYPGGDWVDIGDYNGSRRKTRYRLSELEVEEMNAKTAKIASLPWKSWEEFKKSLEVAND